MSTQEIKKELHHYIDHADLTFLKMVHAMTKVYEKESIVGYDIDGTPISEQILKNRVKSASKRVKSGEFISQEEIEKEIENW